MTIRKPTRKELNELSIIDLTSAEVWNPRANETDTELYGHQMDEDGNFTNIIHCKATSKPEKPDMQHLTRCLGWKSEDVIKKTLENTTQYAENVVRLPMRMNF